MNVFKIRREERWIALAATIISGILNALSVAKYYGQFSQLTDNYRNLFIKWYHVSGFDPLTYVVLSNWDTSYNVYRHPLLAFFMFPLNQLNQGLMMLTGMNWATIIVALLLVACSVYSCIFLYRIVREQVGVSAKQACLLCAFFFSFGFIMLSMMVPDHFLLSMTMLLLTLSVAHRPMSAIKTIVLFVFTAGISLNNGLKIFIAALYERRKRFFRPKYLLGAVLIPAALMWGFARWEYRTFVWPKEMARNEKKAQQNKAKMEQLRKEVADSLNLLAQTTMTAQDSQRLNAEVEKVRKQRAKAKYAADRKKIWNKNTGKPMAKGEFMRWTDISTPRWDTAVENLFGEAVMLHRDNLLGDVLRDRPVIVRYRCWVNYAFEIVMLLMFAIGIWYGRRSRLMWTAFSFFAMDMFLHVGLGFGINEIYIMSAHYMFAIPIAIAFTLRHGSRLMRNVTIAALAVSAVFFWIWNSELIIEFMLR